MHHVYIRTYGCQMNERDTEALGALLQSRGFALAPDEASADIILLNTCSVRDLAESKAVGKASILGRRRRRDPRFLIGVMGCMAQNRGEALLKDISGGVDLIVGTQQAHHIPEFLEALTARAQRGDPIVALNAEDQSQEHVAGHLRCGPAAFVSIQQGCDMHCSYCIVPKTRGAERSRSLVSILAEVQKLADAGTKEITLLGQIVNHYARRIYPTLDGKTPFVQLLEAVHDIDGIERIRFTSPHPHGFGEDLIAAFARLPKLCPYIHLPAQSGSDAVLKAMKRPYTRKRYLSLVDALRAARGDISFSTDLIVGFPGETDEDFLQTLDLFNTVGFEMAYVFKYSPRAGTPAAERADMVPEDVMEARNQALLERLAHFSMKGNEAQIGTVQDVLVEGPARKGEGVLMGYTVQHRKTLFPGPDALVGQIVPVSIERATVSTLLGKSVI